ncbi:MAG: YfhO family protein, partial [Ruminococcus sp.]|nr:YfhO family protein [Ruminococcus sp.]
METETQEKLKLPERLKRYLPVIISPLLVAAAVLYVFRLRGLYPFGTRTAAWCDMNQQVVPLLCQFKDILDGKSGMLLSMKNASGMNFWGVFFFFLASPFTLLVKFVDNGDMLVFMDILIVLKMCVCAVTTSLYFTVSDEHRSLDGISRTMLGFIYAMSGYTMLFYQNIIWLDMVYLFPLMLISLERMKKRGSPVMYTVMLTLMMVVNYYLGYMLVLFLLLTAGLCAVYSLRGGDISPRFFRSFVTGSVTAALMSAAVWLPCFIQYLSSGRRGELLDNLRSGHIVTDYDTVLPVIMCCAVLILLAGMDMYIRKNRTPQHRLTFFLALLTLIPLIIEPVNKMWHTGSYMAFPARYAFMTIFMLMQLAAYRLEEVPRYRESMKLYIFGGVAGAATLMIYMLSASDYVERFGETLSDYTRALGGT